MRLHTSYLDHLRIAPGRNADGVEFVRAFNSTRHCGDDDAPRRTAEHPADHEPTGDVTAYNRVAPGLPGLWCPWTCCSTGCCRHWNGVEKPSAQSAWLSYLSDTFLRPGAALAGDGRARRLGLTVDHVLDGVLVGERRETAELLALEGRDNAVRQRVLVPGAEGRHEWGYRSPAWERESRQERQKARRLRFRAAVADDRSCTG